MHSKKKTLSEVPLEVPPVRGDSFISVVCKIYGRVPVSIIFRDLKGLDTYAP